MGGGRETAYAARASVGVEGHSEDRGTLATPCVLDPKLIGRIMAVIRIMWF